AVHVERQRGRLEAAVAGGAFGAPVAAAALVADRRAVAAVAERRTEGEPLAEAVVGAAGQAGGLERGRCDRAIAVAVAMAQAAADPESPWPVAGLEIVQLLEPVVHVVDLRLHELAHREHLRLDDAADLGIAGRIVAL